MPDAVKTMRGVDLYDLGYHELVSVVPPGATIAPKSTLRPEFLGKAPGKRNGEGKWYGYNFTGKDAPSRRSVEAYDSWGANIGLMARHFPAVDIDVESPKLRDFVMKIAAEKLGEAPVRHSREPRALLMYCCTEPFARMQLSIEHNGKSHLIEVLAGDRQYLIAGTHPSGNPYTWEGGLWAPDDLYQIDKDMALDFLKTVQSRLAERGIASEIKGTGEVKETVAPPQDHLLAPSVEALQELVEKLPNNADVAATWDNWIMIGHAIKAAAGNDPAGEAIFLEWTGRCERVVPADNEEASSQYGRMRAPHRVGWSYLQELADQYAPGYCSAQEDFADSVDMNAASPDAAPVVQDTLPTEFTDDAISVWLQPRLRHRMLQAVKVGWYVWNGSRWVRDQDESGYRIIFSELRSLCRRMKDRAASMPGKQGVPMLKAAENYSQEWKISAITRMIMKELTVSPDAFDRDPWSLNTPGGAVDLRTGRLSPVTAGGMHARAVCAVPQAGPKPLWDQYLIDLTEGNQDYADYLQKVFGYMLTGDMREKCLWYLWGPKSDTGKTTLVNILRGLFGSYSDYMDAGVFLYTKGEHIPAELARMPGARLVLSSEPEHGRAWSEKTIKQITGSDEMEVRFLRKNPFTFRPVMKLLIVGNSEPEIKRLDDAMQRRIHILPAKRPVPVEKRIADLSTRIVAEEGAAVLAWMIEGCLKWQRTGLSVPPVVVERDREYFEDEDVVGMWAYDCCEFDDQATVSRDSLYRAWATWARSHGEDPGSFRQFKRRMEPLKDRKGLVLHQVGDKHHRQQGYRGIRLRSRVEEGLEAEL